MTEAAGSNAWTTYWQANRLDSCISRRPEDDPAELFRFWASVLDGLPEAATVIDLATGNGAVAVRLAQAARRDEVDITIDAVDLADIQPDRFLIDYQDVTGAIRFRGATDICALPFEDASFDVAVSQFGFEYAPAAQATAETVRVLRPGGKFQFLMHHSESALVAPNVAQVAEVDALLAPFGVVESLLTFLDAEPDARNACLETLEYAGQALVGSVGGQLPRISHEIFTNVRLLLERTDLSFRERHEAALGMHGRLVAERERMAQLRAAALSTAEAEAVADHFRSAGATITALEEFRIGEDKALLGWCLRGHR